MKGKLHSYGEPLLIFPEVQSTFRINLLFPVIKIVKGKFSFLIENLVFLLEAPGTTVATLYTRKEGESYKVSRPTAESPVLFCNEVQKIFKTDEICPFFRAASFLK